MRSIGHTTIQRILAVLAAGTLISGATANADFVFGEPRNLGPLVNSGQDVMGLCISSEGLSLYFYADLPGGYGAQDLWVTTRETTDADWGTPENLGPGVNSSRGIEMPSISTDGLTLYFNDYADLPLPGGYGYADIWMTTRATVADLWSEPVNVGPPINGGLRDVHPCISADDLSLYFVKQVWSGQMELWMARRPAADADWQTAVSLGPTVNTSGVNIYPTVSSDERVLFFNHNPLTDSRLFMAWRPNKDADWKYVIEVPAPIGGDGANFDASISHDGHTLYFSSTRTGNYGFVDAWESLIQPVVDFNGDSQVDAQDVLVMMDHWGTDASLCDIGPMPWGDGVVDAQDLLVLAQHMVEKAKDPNDI